MATQLTHVSMLHVPLRTRAGCRAKCLMSPIRRCTDLSLSIWRRRFATITDLNKYPQPGEQLHGFTLRRTKHVPELQLTAFDLQHDKTGAEYLHVARDDKNNVFSVGFKTNPPDDTGVPHILEHTTLCGSEKYLTHRNLVMRIC